MESVLRVEISSICVLPRSPRPLNRGQRPAMRHFLRSQFPRSAVAAFTLQLDRRTLGGTVRAEDTAIAGLWPNQGFALHTFIKKETRVRRHRLCRFKATMRTSQHRLEDDFRRLHFCVPLCNVEGKPAFVVAFTNAGGLALLGSYFTVAVL